MLRAQDLGDYYKIPPDSRDLNYGQYFSKGEVNFDEVDDYTSHNTEVLDKNNVKKLLLSLDYIKEMLND